MVTPDNDDEAPGYSTLTVESVNIQSGFTPNLDFTGSFLVRDEESNEIAFAPPARVVPQSLVDADNLEQKEVFYITIHSVDSGAAGVGSGQLGDGSSLIGFKILETGSYTDVTVPIYPVGFSTDVRALDGEDQQFPPDGGDGSPTVQAAAYDTSSFGSPLPSSPVATSEPVTVDNGLDQNPERDPIGPGDLEDQ